MRHSLRPQGLAVPVLSILNLETGMEVSEPGSHSPGHLTSHLASSWNTCKIRWTNSQKVSYTRWMVLGPRGDRTRPIGADLKPRLLQQTVLGRLIAAPFCNLVCATRHSVLR
jgi:hypothetical protein